MDTVYFMKMNFKAMYIDEQLLEIIHNRKIYQVDTLNKVRIRGVLIFHAKQVFYDLPNPRNFFNKNVNH